MLISLPPVLDIIVVNHRTPGFLYHFLRALEDNLPTVPFSLSVCNIDPQKDDIDLAMAVQNRLEYFHHLHFATDVGYARAVNRAAKRTSGDVLVAFNADTIISPGSLDECYQALQNHTNWGILGPRLVDEQHRLTHGGIFPGRHQRGWREQDVGQYNDVVDDAYDVSGAAYFIKRDCWEALSSCPIYQASCPSAEGAFLPTQLFWEEEFCSLHAREHGWAVVYYGPVVLQHCWHGAITTKSSVRLMPVSKHIFDRACDEHGINHP